MKLRKHLHGPPPPVMPKGPVSFGGVAHDWQPTDEQFEKEAARRQAILDREKNLATAKHKLEVGPERPFGGCLYEGVELSPAECRALLEVLQKK